MKKSAWYGRCIFISWYCDVGTCSFCFRSTQKSRIRHASHAKRSLPSILTEALLAKKLGWRIEFLTGGYNIYPIDELVNIARLVSKVYKEKIWLNLGAIKKHDLELFRPYIKGVVASIETINPELHKKICPDKAMQPYEDMFENSKHLKKSMTIVIGLGEKKEDFELLCDFIQKHKLDRITFYALKPVHGTPYTHGPSTQDYVWWIQNTRKQFSKLQIIAGTTFNRVRGKGADDDEIDQLMRAGADAITKFPATKRFGSPEAQKIEQQVSRTRKFLGSLTRMPDIDWDAEADALDIDDELKDRLKITLHQYVKKMSA